MIYQHHRNLVQTLQNSGCYFLSLCFIGQVETRTVMTSQDINNLFYYSLKKNWVDTEATIKNPDKILAQIIGIDKLYQIGVEENRIPTFWGWVKDKNYNWVITEYKTSGKYGTHFVACDKNKNEFYDPLLGEGYKSLGVNKFVFYKV